MPVGFGLQGGNDPWLCVPWIPGRMLHHKDSALCFPHFFYSHLMARGQDQLPWESPAPSSSFCWNDMNILILRINENDGGDVGMTAETLALASFPGLQELSRQSKGQIKTHQPGKTVGIPLLSISLSLCSEPPMFQAQAHPPGANSPCTSSQSHLWIPCHRIPPWIPDQTKCIPHPTWPLLAAAPSLGCAKGLYGSIPPTRM